MTTKWVGIPAVPKGSQGEYTFWDAIKQNLQTIQSKLDGLSSSTSAGAIVAGAGLTGGGDISTNPTVSALPDLVALSSLSDGGFVKRVGPGNFILVPSTGGAPGDSYNGDPVGSQPNGWLHEDLLTGNIWASHITNGYGTPTVVNTATTTSVNAVTGGSTDFTIPWTPTPGNLIIAMCDGGYAGLTAPTGWTLIDNTASGFERSATFAKIYGVADSPTTHLWPIGAILTQVWEIAGAGTGTVASAIDSTSIVDAQVAGSVSGFSNTTAVPNELMLCIAGTASIHEPDLLLTPGFTIDNTVLHQMFIAGHKLIPAQGTAATAYSTINTGVGSAYPTNRSMIMVLIKPGLINVSGWSFIGPVATYNHGTKIDTQLKSINLTGSASASSDGSGNITVTVPTSGSSSGTVHFGTGAPSTLYTDGDNYYDTTSTTYAQYVQNSSAWSPVGGSGGGSAITVYDEGSSLTAALASLNFVGAGVTATNTGGAVTVTIPGSTGGGGGGSTSVTPTVRSSNIQVSSNNTYRVAWPSGTVAGDLVVIFGGHAWDFNNPTGWTVVDNQTGPYFNGAAWWKVMTAADITAGSIAITTVSSLDGVVSAVTITGGTFSTVGTVVASRNSSGATSVGLTTDATPTTSDLMLYFGGTRANVTCSETLGTQLQTLGSGAACGVLSAGVPTTAGAQSPTFYFSGAGSGYYVAALRIVAATGVTYALSGEGPVTAPPAASTWTLQNFDSTKTHIENITSPVAGVRIREDAFAYGNTNNLRAVLKPIPGAHWQVTARIRRHASMTSYMSYGLVLRDSVSQNSIIFGYDWEAGGLGFNKFNSDASYNGAGALGNWPYVSNIWIRLLFDGTNTYFQTSADGVYFATHWKNTNFTLTNMPTHVGFGYNANNNGNGQATQDVDCLSWSLITLP